MSANLSNIRVLSHVPRWVIMRRIHTQSVAEHSFYVTIYAGWLYKEFKLPVNPLHLMGACLFHDAEEAFTGDIPGPAKRNMKPDMSTFEDLCIENFDCYYATDDPKIKLVVKVADLIDECLYLTEELGLGNKHTHNYLQAARYRVEAAWWKMMRGLEVPADTDQLDKLKNMVYPLETITVQRNNDDVK